MDLKLLHVQLCRLMTLRKPRAAAKQSAHSEHCISLFNMNIDDILNLTKLQWEMYAMKKKILAPQLYDMWTAPTEEAASVTTIVP